MVATSLIKGNRSYTLLILGSFLFHFFATFQQSGTFRWQGTFDKKPQSLREDTMRQILSVLLLLLLVTPVFAQEDMKADAPFTPVAVTAISLFVEDEGAYLIISGTPASCDPVIVEQVRYDYLLATGFKIDLFTPTAADGAVCNTLLPFTQRVELGKLLEDSFYLFFVNDYSASVFVPRQDAVPMDILAQIATWNGETVLEPHFRSDSMIEDVEFSISEANTIIAQVKGAHGDGCEFPTIIGIVPDALDENRSTLQIFRAMPLAVMCPAILLYFDEIIDTGLAADQEHILQVGEVTYHYTPADQQFTPINRAYNQISQVEFLPTAAGYDVLVSAQQGGECGAPLREIVHVTGYATFIEIFNDVAVDAICTRNIIGHELRYAVQQLPVIINGIAYSPQTTSAGNGSGEGAMLQVEHLVESVDVLVLESFPMQLTLRVRGYQPDGCQAPVQVTQQVDGNNVQVKIFRELPADAICPMVAVMYEEDIRIEGTFTGGRVDIQVNQFTTNIDL
jgi:hypothetical protein